MLGICDNRDWLRKQQINFRPSKCINYENHNWFRLHSSRSLFRWLHNQSLCSDYEINNKQQIAISRPITKPQSSFRSKQWEIVLIFTFYVWIFIHPLKRFLTNTKNTFLKSIFRLYIKFQPFFTCSSSILECSSISSWFHHFWLNINQISFKNIDHYHHHSIITKNWTRFSVFFSNNL